MTNFALSDIFAFNTPSDQAITKIKMPKKRIVVNMRIMPGVHHTIRLLEKFMQHVRRQGRLKGRVVRTFRRPNAFHTSTRQVEEEHKYRFRLRIDARETKACLAELVALQSVVAGDEYSSIELSNITKAFRYAAKGQVRRIKTIGDRAEDDAKFLKQIKDSLAHHRHKGAPMVGVARVTK